MDAPYPARLMLKVWAVCIILYVVLPFQLLNWTLSVKGYVVLFLFILCFCIGTLFITPYGGKPASGRNEQLDFSAADTLLRVLAIIAIVSLAVDLQGKSILDLAKAYELRSEQASAMLSGALSTSSFAFQVGFLTYPAGYVYVAREIIFARTPSMLKIVCLGFLPVLMASMAQGGRAPLFLAFVIAYLAWRIRKTHRAGAWAAEPSPAPGPGDSRTRLANRIAFIAGLVAATIYFAAIFLVRADSSPGGMLQAAEVNWGIGFRGLGGDTLLDLLGEQLTYFLFVFVWYIVSGLIMSNILFTDYTGPAQLGIYGIDLATALMRRIDANLVAHYFDTLMQVGTYGFLPSAFGSLYVDFSYFGLIICALWGYAAALVYRNATIRADERWLLLVPFVTLGIVFSVVNTPLGFSNGFMIHVWLLAAFALARRPQPAQAIVGVRRRIGQAR